MEIRTAAVNCCRLLVRKAKGVTKNNKNRSDRNSRSKGERAQTMGVILVLTKMMYLKMHTNATRKYINLVASVQLSK